ncbi:paraquat-inducible protein A [Vibrio sonorensis]|uniref:paraquat-inducible protein A n=1 Tax=Vibrio sonorensis TaxID=1004316 RepID=UPI0008D8D66D|nr:paraquat-inducible protein A [Vibrio sonorensis]
MCHSKVQHETTVKDVRLCEGCELPIEKVHVKSGKSAFCPRCGTRLYRGGKPSLSGNLAVAVTCLLLFVPSHFFDFISIRLFGMMISATLPEGVVALYQEGFVFLSGLILFCSSIAPFIVCSAVVCAHLAMKLRKFHVFRASLYLIQHLKHWVMIDVFLVSVAVSCFKLQDYSDIYVGKGLFGLILLQLFTVLLLTRVNVQTYWEAWQPESRLRLKSKSVHCTNCHLSQPEQDQCQRCDNPLHHRKPRSLQRTAAYLVAASVAIFPANLIPISVLLTKGQRLEDTIFSGVASLVNNGMTGIAIIIFVASIVVPVAKILGLAYLLLAIRYKRRAYHRHRMMIYFVVKWIGKWSMMDLFVISIMMTLVDRGQILDFTPGYGAVAFGTVVILTMLAADSLDPRYIWQNYKEPSDRKKFIHE